MRYAICNETFQNWGWTETCEAIAQAGYDGVEIAPFTLAEDVRTISAEARQDYLAVAKSAGLEIVGLHWLLVSPKGLSVTSGDPDLRRRTAEYLGALARFCAELGGRTLVLGSPAQRRLPTDVPPEKAAQIATDRLLGCIEPALEVAQQHGITLCLEPLPAPEADFMLTLQAAVDIIQRHPHPALGTIFDVKSAISEGTPLPDLIHSFAPQIAHVHANDANRRGPGFGATDYVPLFTALHQIHYPGYVSVEVFDYTPDAVTIAQESLTYMRRCEQEALHAV